MKSFRQLTVGDRVQAKIRVYDLSGKDFGPPHPRAIAKYGAFAAHVHAEPGELGTVVGRDGNTVTVTFARTETTTDVVSEEVDHVPDEWCARTWRNVLHTMAPGARMLPLEKVSDAARVMGYFYFVWNGRVLISKAYGNRPWESWPTIEEFFSKE